MRDADAVCEAGTSAADVVLGSLVGVLRVHLGPEASTMTDPEVFRLLVCSAWAFSRVAWECGKEGRLLFSELEELWSDVDVNHWRDFPSPV